LGKPKAAGSLFSLALTLGWLNEVGVAEENPREKVYGFYHATFQEYFAALAVEDWDYFLPKDHCDRPVEGKRYRIFEPQWKPVILLWLGREDVSDEDKLEFVIKLTDFNDGCRKIYGLKSAFLVTEGISQLKDVDILIPYKEYNYQEYKQYPLTVALIDNLIRAALWDFDVEPKKWIIYNQCFVKDAQEVLKRTTRSKVIAILEQKLSSISRCYLMNSVFKEKTQAEAEAQFKEIYTNREEAYLIANKMLCLEKMKVYLENIGYRSKIDDIFANFVDFLWEIDPENELITSSVSCLITTTENPRERLNTIKWLLTIVPDHPALVEGLVKTIMTASDSDSEWRDHEEAAQILGKVNPGNPLAVNWLLKLLDNNQDEIHCWPIAYHLGLVDPGNIQAQAVLLKIVETTQNEDIRWHLANCLERY
ncbi:MAG: HEAT repeat domain-containing protein, partial [Planktothrix sp.]